LSFPFSLKGESENRAPPYVNLKRPKTPLKGVNCQKPITGRKQPRAIHCRFRAIKPISHGLNQTASMQLEESFAGELTSVETSCASIERLAALVPRPRLHLIRFHGVLAPNAKLRRQIVPAPLERAAEPSSQDATRRARRRARAGRDS